MIHHLPLYGNITDISSAGTSKLTALCFDLASNTHIAHFIDLQTVFGGFDQKKREQGVESHILNQPVVATLSSSNNQFIVTECELLIHKANELKNLCSFSQVPTHAAMCENNDIVIVFNSSELCVFDENGAEKQRLSLSDKTTALALSSDGDTCAVGYQTGFVEVLKRTKGGLFRAVVKDSNSKGTNPVEMHKDSAVSALSILRYEDNRDWLLSFGEDRTVMQAHTEELIASEKATSGLHNGIVSGILSPISLNKVYTIAQDGEAKSWRRTQSKYPPATVHIVKKAQSCALVRFPIKDTNSKQMIDGKFLAIAGGDSEDSSVQFWSFETENDSDNLLTKEHVIQIGKDWIEHFANTTDENVQKHIITTIANWNVRFLDSLVNFAKNQKFQNNMISYFVY